MRVPPLVLIFYVQILSKCPFGTSQSSVVDELLTLDFGALYISYLNCFGDFTLSGLLVPELAF